MSSALIDLADAQWTGSGTVNIGTGVGYRLADLIDAVARAVGVAVELVCEPADSVEVEHTLAATDRLRAIIGWVPRTDLDQLAARQVAAFDAARLTPAH